MSDEPIDQPTNEQIDEEINAALDARATAMMQQCVPLPLVVIDDSEDNEGNAIPGTEDVVLIEYSCEHIRLIFGDEDDSPNLYVERRPDGFDVVVHPHDGDPALIIEHRTSGTTVKDGTGFKTLAFVDAD